MPLNDEPREGSVRYEYLYAAYERNARQRDLAWHQLFAAGLYSADDRQFFKVDVARWPYRDLDCANQMTIKQRDRAWHDLSAAGIEIQLPLEVL